MRAFMEHDNIKPAKGGSSFISVSVQSVDIAWDLQHIIISKARNIVLLPGD